MPHAVSEGENKIVHITVSPSSLLLQGVVGIQLFAVVPDQSLTFSVC
jgi:hypothetical protein